MNRTLRFLLLDLLLFSATLIAAGVLMFFNAVLSGVVLAFGLLLLLLLNAYRIVLRLLTIENWTRFTADSIFELQNVNAKNKK